MFDFRRETVFLFGMSLLKHKMSPRYAKNWGVFPLEPLLGYAYGILPLYIPSSLQNLFLAFPSYVIYILIKSSMKFTST